jgi:hypothetical protein
MWLPLRFRLSLLLHRFESIIQSIVVGIETKVFPEFPVQRLPIFPAIFVRALQLSGFP